jgi:hypothetical protein
MPACLPAHEALTCAVTVVVVGTTTGVDVGAAVVAAAGTVLPSNTAFKFLKLTEPKPVVGSLHMCGRREIGV